MKRTWTCVGESSKEEDAPADEREIYVFSDEYRRGVVIT